MKKVNFLFNPIAEELVQKKIEDIQEKVHLDQNVEGAYLTHLLLSDKMTVTEILGSMTELLLAGVDTVSSGCALCGPFFLHYVKVIGLKIFFSVMYAQGFSVSKHSLDLLHIEI